jgi:hypothetical protein
MNRRRNVLTSNEKSIAGEHSLIIAILKEKANAVLGVTGRMQSSNLDAFTDIECRFMARGFCNFIAVLPTNYRERILLKLVGTLVSVYFWKLERLAVADGEVGDFTISAFPPAWSP